MSFLNIKTSFDLWFFGETLISAAVFITSTTCSKSSLYRVNNTAVVYVNLRDFPPAQALYALLRLIAYRADMNPFIGPFPVFSGFFHKVK